MKEKLANLIRDEDFERIELIQKKPNIFESLDLVRMELKHSRFLSWLLDPGENHGLGETFLRKFLRDIFSDDKADGRVIFDADTLDCKQVEIRREWRNIDILIILDQDVVVIENKVGSSDHSHQLSRYLKITEQNFKTRKKHFVYLTPFGEEPTEKEALSKYIIYSYAEISRILENVIEIHGENMNDRSRIYIEDYHSMVKRFILMNDKLNDLAISVYKSHREALDFIFENKPDPASELYQYFVKRIRQEGWVLGSKNKGYVRFLTKELDELIPKGGGVGWPDKEIFLFEIKYYWLNRKAKFIVVISPGDEDLREKIHKCLLKYKDYKPHTGKKWMVNYFRKFDFDADQLMLEDVKEIEKAIDKIITKIKPTVEEISRLIQEGFSVQNL